MRSHALLALWCGTALLAACGAPQNGYAVNLRVAVDSSVLDDEIARARTLRLAVLGETTPYSKDIALGEELRGRRVNIVYRPGLSVAGDLTFSIALTDENGTPIGAGNAIAHVEPGATTFVDLLVFAGPPVDGGLPDLVRPPDLVVVAKKLGEACVNGSDVCETGFCVDGICCDTACTASCMACNLPSFVGTCSPVPNGADPIHGMCAALAPDDLDSPCSTDGKCNGAGACRLHPINTPCSQAKCDAATNLYTAPSVCDGASRCIAVPAQPCAPYTCNGNRCFAACGGSGATECQPPNTCVGGSCGKLPNGRDCTSDIQCESNICADGVCCNARCDGQCEACDADATKRGQCLPVTGAPHLTNGRVACTGGASTCGGTCNGAKRDACTYPSTSVTCRTQSCAVESGAPTLTLAATCDGAGHCPLAKATCQSSAPSNTVPRCAGTSCDYSQCIPGYANCGGGPDCETNLNSDSNNCGACGNVCSNQLAKSSCNGAGTCACTDPGAVVCDSSSPPECYVPTATRCCRPNGAYGCTCNYKSQTCVRQYCIPGNGCVCVEYKYTYACGLGDCGLDFIDHRFDQTAAGGTCAATLCNAWGGGEMACDYDAR